VVTAGRGREGPGDPVNVPVPMTSIYRTGGSLDYGRDSNAVWEALEEVLGALEGGRALVFASGMAAIAAVIETLAVGATVVVAEDAYNGTRHFLNDLAGRGRLSMVTADVTDTTATLLACEKGADLLWLESPTNPLMAVADLAALTEGAHRLGLAVVVDNTFATPLLQRPLDLGADVVVHSVTKFLSGHSDLVMGAAVARQDGWWQALSERRSVYGGVAGPLEAFLALRGVRTLAVRLEKAQENAGELARRLAEHPRVTRVRYPGLADHPGHELAARQMRGFGAMLAFEVKGGAAGADAVCDAVRLCTPATSLGGVETLIERRGRWRGEGATPADLLRLSVGIEAMEDLWADLDQALTAAASG